ncbi:MAG: FKBP-type peptidyl-prolyl cis-trans isomerase [Deltaproteobacteria bacterium]|nr:FKBP-type peptidyl-prolyl cis-trans isomerase [Deltaproteobacteria bacterium]
MADLQIENLKAGAGAEAKPGMNVTVHYVGTLTSGEKFDSSRDRNEGFTFELGAGEVIKGWDQGVAGMKIGEVRKLTLPPHLAYGARGFPPVIPANATLVFEVELLSVE